MKKADDRKYNEKKWYKLKGYLPLRMYNYEIALYKQKGDYIKAMNMCELFFIRDDKPVYLPDYLNEQRKLPLDEKHYTYGRIFKELEELSFN